MGNMALGGGGRFAAYAAAHGRAAALQHCYDKYGKAACQAMHTHGTAAAPQARRAAKKIKAKKQEQSANA